MQSIEALAQPLHANDDGIISNRELLRVDHKPVVLVAGLLQRQSSRADHQVAIAVPRRCGKG